MEKTWIRKHEKGSVLLIYVQPGASKPGISGLHGERLKIKIKAPPVDGEANKALIEFVADLLGTSKSKIFFIRGESSRQKDLLVELPMEEVLLKCEGRL